MERPEHSSARSDIAGSPATPETELEIEAARARLSRFDPRRLTFPASLYPFLVLFGLNAVDELDRSAFSVLVPEIREHFQLNFQGVLTLSALVGLTGILVGPFIGFLADRRNRLKIAAFGAVAWGFFSVLTGFAGNIFVLGLARTGSGLGRVVNQPTHNSLLADFYPPSVRARVYYAHALANPFGQFIAPLAAGFIAAAFSWRAPFIILALPTFVFVLLALSVREPQRGSLDFGDLPVETRPPVVSMRQGIKSLWRVRSYRRVCLAFPFLAMSVAGLSSLLNLFWDEVYGLDTRARGFIQSFDEPFSVAGLIFAGWLSQRFINKDPRASAYFVAIVGIATATLLAVQALSPAIGGVVVAVGASWIRAFFNSMILPGLLTLGSLVLPANVRSLGFASASLFFAPGFIVAPLVGRIADQSGLQVGVLALLPVYLVGSFIMASAAKFIEKDIVRARAIAAGESV